MDNEQLLKELELLVQAMEESLAIIAGTISETTDPRRTLMNFVSAKEAIEAHHGVNEWRDRLLRSALKICALKARSQAANDPILQNLISSVLGDRKDGDSMH